MKKTLKYGVFALFGLMSIFLLAIFIVDHYKRELLEAINQELKEEINGDINIGKLRITIFHDFPNVSLSLQDIYMRGPHYANFHRDFLKAEMIDINVEALRLFRKEIIIQSVDVINGEVFIFKTKTGYTNLDVFKRSRKVDSINQTDKGELQFKNINLKNVRASYHDSLRRKDFEVHFLNATNSIILTDSSTRFHVVGNLKFVGLMFNAEKGSYLKNKEASADFNLEFLTRKRQLLFDSSTLKLSTSDFRLSGFFQVTDPRSFQLNIESDSLDYSEGVSVLPRSLSSKLEKFTVEKNLTVKVVVSGPLIPGAKPAVDMTFSLNNSKASSGKIKMSGLTMKGSLMNHFDNTRINDDQNMLIVFDTIHGKVNGLGFGANASVRGFKNPELNVMAKFDVNLKDLNADSISDIKFEEGRFISIFSYNGKLEEYLDETKERYEGELNGRVSISGGKMEYVPKQMTFENVEASVRFTNDRCEIDNISLQVNKNPLTIKGLFTGVVPFFNKPGKRVKAALKITSQRLDVTKILLKKKETISDSKIAKKKRKISDLIDELYKKLELEIAFDVKQILNKNFKAVDLSGKILLVKDQLHVKRIKMKIAGGQVDFSASLGKLQKEINPFTLSAKVKNADIKDLFYAFNNFNQTTIRHENLSGKVNVDIKLNASINSDLDIVIPSLTGEVELKLVNGRLLDFEPLQKVSNFLFKTRDFSDVQFGEINAQFNMKGTEFDISRMEVQSTVLTLYLEGRYSLVDSTDLSIQVPLSNLKTRDQHIPPENIGTDKRVGASIFLRAHKGKEGTTVITYDPFKRLKKSKKK